MAWALCPAVLGVACPGKKKSRSDGADAGAARANLAKPSPPAIGEVEVSYLAPAGLKRAFSNEDVRKLAHDALLRSGKFKRKGPDPYRADIAVIGGERPALPGEKGSFRAVVTMRLEAKNSPKLETRFLADKPSPAQAQEKKRLTVWRGFLKQALDDAARLVGMQAELERASSDALIAKLDDSDPDVRDQAVQILGVRRVRKAVPGLLKALRDQKERVAQHAIGALVSIGDRRAVPLIVKLTRRRRGLILHQLFYALGSLGGREAEAFLWSMSQGHPSPRAQKAAREALTTLRRKRSSGR